MNALRHARHEQLQGYRIGKAARQRLRQPPSIDPGVHREPRRLREHRHGAADDHLIAEFRGLACAGRTHMGEPSRHRQDIGPHPLDIGGIAARHHRKRALFGAHGAPGHRRIDPSHAVGHFQPRRHSARRVGMDRGEVDHQLSGAGHGGQALGAEYHFLHRRSIGEAHEDDAGGIGHIARLARGFRAGFDQGGGLSKGTVPNRDVVAGLHEAPRHRKSHHAEPEIAQLFRSCPVRHSISPIAAAV